MMFSLFDLHCDTASEMFLQNQGFLKNSLAVSLENAKFFQNYTQVMAIWSDKRLTDENAYSRFFDILNHLKNDEAIFSGQVRFVTDRGALKSSQTSLILAVEDARILSRKMHRIDRLFDAGVRILTPFWIGNNCLGGSHDTTSGLTPFGKKAVFYAMKKGMTVDISHASEKSSYEILEIAQMVGHPAIASHSNAKAICPVSRNLSEELILMIKRQKGLIGLNLYPPFLGESNPLANLLKNIDYFYSLGCREILCFGCDMDGAELPAGIRHPNDLLTVAEMMLRNGYNDDDVKRLFYQNAESFFITHL